jgi:hypothetical protein
MSGLGRWRRLLSDEGGSVVVVATLIATVFILLGTVIIELGHTMEHRRHLQVQTDAAALAAGQEFPLCSTDPASAYGAMRDIANQYGGFSGANQYNQQVGTGSGYAGTISALYQSRPYPAGGTAIADDPDNIFTGTTEEMTCGDPTDANSIKFFDVKATEAGVHNVFNFGLSTTVHAHARVELKAVNQLKGLLPLGVPSPRPEYVFATFINEGGGAVTCTDQSNNPVPSCEEQLTRGNVVGSQQQWILAGQPLKVTIPKGNLGVRIRVVGQGGASTDACDTLYVECYDASTANGVILVRGWDPAASAPSLQAVSLLPGTCTPDAYFTSGDCSAGITADVNLGGVPAAGASVWATIDGTNTKYQLTRPPSPTAGFNTWSLAQGIPVSGPGPHEIALGYNTGSGADKTFGNVQRAFEASSDTSGPLALVQEYEQGNAIGPYSYAGGSIHSIGVTVNTEAALLLSGPNDPPISLRVFKDSGSASRNQSIDCDPALNNLRDEIAQGCTPTYKTQPPGVTPTCPFANQSALWASPQPWNCAAIQTGASVGQVGQGFSLRIFDDQNPPNTQAECDKSPVNWIRGVGFDQTAHPNDKRVVPLFITPLGSFGGTGSGVVPVIDFGFFYVTGYKGDACEGHDANQDRVPNNRGAFVYGHFVKYFPLDNSKTSDFNCNLTTITPCVGVLTR